VWSYDFVAERTHDGRPLKLLTILDEYSRECLAIRVSRRANSMDVLTVLARLFVERGTPELHPLITPLGHPCAPEIVLTIPTAIGIGHNELPESC